VYRWGMLPTKVDIPDLPKSVLLVLSCKAARAVQASSPPTMLEPNLKLEPEIKEELFNIYGYYNMDKWDAIVCGFDK
jgi:hypothetical protein